ncbi:MAG: hypothetical protein WC922_09275 [Synergistaceae bacterium]|jgi:hypothetical protein
MLRRFVNFVLILLVATVYYGHLWGADFENDALDEAEAKRDMMAYVQSTFPHRFGNNLHTGDYVQYELSNHHSGDSEPELNSLEVTDRQNKVVTIKEEFEGNILFYMIDLSSNTLLEYWGYDEDGREHRPVFLSEGEVESRMKSMLMSDSKTKTQSMPDDFAKPRFISLSQSETFSLGRSNLNCEVKALEVPNVEGVTSELRTAVQEFSKVLVSDSVPKMLPAKLMAVYMDNPELFESNNGLVKESNYKLINYNISNK